MNTVVDLQVPNIAGCFLTSCVIDVSDRTVCYEVQWLPSCPLLVHCARRRLKCLY